MGLPTSDKLFLSQNTSEEYLRGQGIRKVRWRPKLRNLSSKGEFLIWAKKKIVVCGVVGKI